MRMTNLTTIEARLINEADRARVAKALDDLESHEELPELVFQALRRLLKLVVSGHDAIVVGSDEQLTSNQAAVLLGMSRPLLNKLLDEGRIPFHRNGRDRRIAMSDISAYIDDRERTKREYVAAAAGYDQRRVDRLAALAQTPEDESVG